METVLHTKVRALRLEVHTRWDGLSAQLLSIRVGHCRGAHLTGLRRGQGNRRILGIKRTANAETLTELARVLAPRKLDRYLGRNLTNQPATPLDREVHLFAVSRPDFLRVSQPLPRLHGQSVPAVGNASSCWHPPQQ